VTELQRIVDALGRTTRRAVAVTDVRGRILAYSSHEGPVDEVRQASIMTRQTPTGSMAWSRSQGIERAVDPVRVPANAEVGMAARVCAPARYRDKLLGYVWLVEHEDPLPDDELSAVRSAADSAALTLHREQLLEVVELGHERELLRDLLSDVEAQREHAADELVDRDLFTQGPAAAVVLRPVRGRVPMTREDQGAREAIEWALAQVRRTLGRRQAMHLVRHDHGLLVLALEPPPSRTPDQLATVGAALHDQLAGALSDQPGWRAVVGLGDVTSGLLQLHATYLQARRAAEAAGLLESFGPVTAWSQLGVYQTLLALPLGELTRAALHPGLVTLLGLRDGSIWLDTLECYFDLGCDARGAAVAMNVQRGTLYHRLHRIEELASVDLHKGDDRLALHLGLKLIRLAGLANGG